MACSYPGTFESSIHSILTSSNYKSAVLKTIIKDLEAEVCKIDHTKGQMILIDLIQN